ncbi:glycosyltransferase [Halapricum hydrolyticum]|uniref:Glycosyltransferase n=1 Tax=Halapricum hydrolyticum TaxID=2979991 RepID=A0AAE3IDB6_9EURY|nr:glycosyltransferase [Halapricum hydrolyticum]MCU4718209.1 glycosyltransferase [Halapricum hydrolyticum]MCU4726350.1 glycosyltransferase [Halapricum hydrolyticum]
MRVLQTPVRFAPSIGGVETYVHSLSRALVEAGHEVSVVCASPDVDVPALETVDGIEVHRLRTTGRIANTDLTPGLPVALLRELRRADVVHTHLPTPWSADVSAFLGLVADRPVVVTYHNDIVGTGLADRVAKLYNRTVLQATLRIADRILITQPAYLQRSPHLKPFAEKVRVVSNGVDTDLFAPGDVPPARQRELGFDPDGRNCFFLSVLDSFHEYKGLDVLLAALAGDEWSEPPRLVVGGEGDAREGYENRAAELGIADRVRFAGRLSTAELVDAYNAADVFVLPSTDGDQEGFGLVLLEALSCGVPVVCTDVVGVADDVRAHDLGVVVEPGDEGALAAAIEDVLGETFDAAAARSLCQEQYSWRSKAAEIVDIYEEIGVGTETTDRSEP